MKRRGNLETALGIVRIPDPLGAFDAPALHFQDQSALRVEQHEVGLHVGSRPLARDIQRVQQHIVVGQLLTQTFEQTRLGLHKKPLRDRIGDASSHRQSVHANTYHGKHPLAERLSLKHLDDPLGRQPRIVAIPDGIRPVKNRLVVTHLKQLRSV